MTEFCPRCSMPIESTQDSAQDPARLCETCGWFGDSSEVLHTPPDPEQFNPVLAAAQAIALYRSICRDELLAEQAFDLGQSTPDEMYHIRVGCRDAKIALIGLFTAAQNRDKA